MKTFLGVGFLIIAKCAASSFATQYDHHVKIDEYFTPTDGDLFQRWRRERLGGIASLFERTDSSKYSREEIEAVLWPVFLPRELPTTLNTTVIDEAMREPVKRAIYSMVVLSELDLACSPSLLNPWNVVTDLQRSANGEIDDHTLALTFVMIVPTCTTVWASLKSIATQHDVNVVQMTHLLAQIGSTEGTKWFIRTLRPRTPTGRPSSRPWPSFRSQST